MKLISWGANSYGQLGQGNKCEQCVTPKQVKLKKELNLKPENIISICGGAQHSLLLDNNGNIFGCGENSRGQLGIDERESLEFVPVLSLTNDKCIQISCGWEFSATVTEKGCLYVWGSNSHGQLGLSKIEYKMVTKPLKIEHISVKFVSCGLRHMTVITNSGSVLICGSGNSGQLGVEVNKNDKTTFIQIPNLSGIKSVACGQKYTIALNENNELFVWGDNKWGQLSFDPNKCLRINTPQKISVNFDKITQLHVGWSHVCVLTDKNEIWNWGRNNYGQLGRSTDCEWKPDKLNLCDIKYLSVASEHNVAVTTNGQLFSWGWNEHGNCGTGNEVNITEPFLINSCKSTCVGSGTGQSFAVIIEDKL